MFSEICRSTAVAGQSYLEMFLLPIIFGLPFANDRGRAHSEKHMGTRAYIYILFFLVDLCHGYIRPAV